MKSNKLGPRESSKKRRKIAAEDGEDVDEAR
jgi:hypothetical protein